MWYCAKSHSYDWMQQQMLIWGKYSYDVTYLTICYKRMCDYIAVSILPHVEGWKWTSLFFLPHNTPLQHKKHATHGQTLPQSSRPSRGPSGLGHLNHTIVYIYNSGFQTITAEPYKIIRLMPMNFPKIGSQPSRIIWVILAWSKVKTCSVFFWITIFDALAPGWPQDSMHKFL